MPEEEMPDFTSDDASAIAGIKRKLKDMQPAATAVTVILGMIQKKGVTAVIDELNAMTENIRQIVDDDMEDEDAALEGAWKYLSSHVYAIDAVALMQNLKKKGIANDELRKVGESKINELRELFKDD